MNDCRIKKIPHGSGECIPTVQLYKSYTTFYLILEIYSVFVAEKAQGALRFNFAMCALSACSSHLLALCVQGIFELAPNVQERMENDRGHEKRRQRTGEARGENSQRTGNLCKHPWGLSSWECRPTVTWTVRPLCSCFVVASAVSPSGWVQVSIMFKGMISLINLSHCSAKEDIYYALCESYQKQSVHW